MLVRYLQPFIEEDLGRKMVFLGGPRQVGKTTLAKRVLEGRGVVGGYYNWDDIGHRRQLLRHQWSESLPLVVFDELHKFKHWKRWIKGLFDVRNGVQNYLVTGSARLDVYRRGGDSMLGRYHYWRLHPLSLDEWPEDFSRQEAYERLFELGGFPEPFLSGDARQAKRWRRDRLERVVHEDIRDLGGVRDLQLLRYLVEMLRDRVGGEVVYANLAEDLQVSAKTVQQWCGVLESMYLVYRVTPYAKGLSRVIRKAPKYYFSDHADVVGSPGARLENMVASSLLKRLHFLEDYAGESASLHYLRDKSGREVDFVTVVNGQVEALLEVKTSSSSVSAALKHYRDLLKPKRTIQLVQHLQQSFYQDGVWVCSLADYFQDPPWASVRK